MRRREVIASLGGAAIITSLSGQAPQMRGRRRVGALVAVEQADPEAQGRAKAFAQGLQEQGFREGDIEIDWRWAGHGTHWIDWAANELITTNPDVLVVSSTALTGELLKRTRSIPVIFVLVADPVASGFVERLAKPGGNATGFLNFEASIASKWVQLLNDVAGELTHIAIIFNPETAISGGEYFYRPFAAAAVAMGIRPQSAPLDKAEDVGVVVAAIAAEPKGGIVVGPDLLTAANQRLIVAEVARVRLPAIYPFRYFAAAGGLMSYGVDTRDAFRLAGDYVGRVLKGARAAELPVQAPTKFEFVVNLATAKEFGLTIPPSLLARADEVIE